MASRFEELAALERLAREQFREHERRATEFVAELQRAMASFLGCEANKVSLLRWKEIDKEHPPEGIKELATNQRMALGEDAFYRFALGLDLAPGEARYIRHDLQIHAAVKPLGGRYVFRWGEQERRVALDDPTEMEALCASIFEGVKEFIRHDFENFLNGKASRIGFVKN